METLQTDALLRKCNPGGDFGNAFAPAAFPIRPIKKRDAQESCFHQTSRSHSLRLLTSRSALQVAGLSLSDTDTSDAVPRSV
jgi:hypothetical protein